MKLRTDPDLWDWGPPKDRPAAWPDDPDVRRIMEWLRGLIPPEDWKSRRFAHVSKLHGVGIYYQSRKDMPNLPHTYVADEDIGGWYLMLAEAYVDHIADYEPAQGSRVIPLFKVLGRYFDLLMEIEGVEERARRMLTTERRQPDSVLFELLVALSYRRDGWPVVRFIEEHKGGTKTPDIQIFAPMEIWSIECKRIQRSQYSRDERDQFWRLWRHAMPRIEAHQPNLFFDLNFRRELKDVPDSYVDDLVHPARFRAVVRGSRWAESRERTCRMSGSSIIALFEYAVASRLLFVTTRGKGHAYNMGSDICDAHVCWHFRYSRRSGNTATWSRRQNLRFPTAVRRLSTRNERILFAQNGNARLCKRDILGSTCRPCL